MQYALLFRQNIAVTIAALLWICISLRTTAQSASPPQQQEYYRLQVYHYTSAGQEAVLDNYFKAAYVPALHNAGIQQVGIFKAMTNDTAADKRIYIFLVSSSLEKLTGLPGLLQKDHAYVSAAEEYIQAAFDHPPFTRIETILLQAFRLAPQMKQPALAAGKKERVYELRSYEGPTEKLYNKKVEMFNEGGEIELFKRLNFNAIFYAEVISGSRMPNLMYMTSFENMEDRNTHWNTFMNDPEWKRLSALPEYQHTVSKADIIFLKAADYSDL